MEVSHCMKLIYVHSTWLVYTNDKYTFYINICYSRCGCGCRCEFGCYTHPHLHFPYFIQESVIGQCIFTIQRFFLQKGPKKVLNVQSWKMFILRRSIYSKNRLGDRNICSNGRCSLIEVSLYFLSVLVRVQ
jgi:hypothetical protein